ncbi:hypothetical protein M3O75_17940 [Klebsiella pneumoniae]|nr:hypothetical protein [Klebsiella pneumoniae subsp. pneumoniae]MDQ6191558.1 hypothetical protein [Klebsiella pneumoniae]
MDNSVSAAKNQYGATFEREAYQMLLRLISLDGPEYRLTEHGAYVITFMTTKALKNSLPRQYTEVRMSNNFGNYYIEIDADVLPFLKGMDKVQSTLDALSADSKNGSKAFDNLSSSASSAGTSFSELAGYARSMDSSLKTLNSNVNAITRAMQEAGSSAGGAGAEFTRAEAILENLGTNWQFSTKPKKTAHVAQQSSLHRSGRARRPPMKRSRKSASLPGDSMT